MHRRNSSGSRESSGNNSDQDDMMSGSKSPLLSEQMTNGKANQPTRCKASVTTPELHNIEGVEDGMSDVTQLTTSRSDSRIQQRPSVTFLTQRGVVSTLDSASQIYRRNSSVPTFEPCSGESLEMKYHCLWKNI